MRFFLVRVIVNGFDVQWHPWLEYVLSYREKRPLISFHHCRIFFQILLEETFSMLFDLSRCSSAENSCNLHAIIAILLIFLHTYLVFLLRPSSFIYIIDWKTSWCNISWCKRSRHKNQIAMTSDSYAQQPMKCLTDKEWVIKNR